MRILDTAALKYHRSMNPCPLYDEFTGTVFLFFITVLGKVTESYQIITGQNHARFCYVSSSDQGHSWSTITDLTKQVIGSTIKDWATFALGPGHGIQLQSGRLLVPAYAYYINCKECFGKICKTTPHAFTFYSDDHGKSWKCGEFVPNLETVECQVSSVYEEDGTSILYCNARSSLGFRVQALSSDGGAVFHSGQLVQKLVEPLHGCHGSIIGFPAPLEFNTSLLPQQTKSYAHPWFVSYQKGSECFSKVDRLQNIPWGCFKKVDDNTSVTSLSSRSQRGWQWQERFKESGPSNLQGSNANDYLPLAKPSKSQVELKSGCVLHFQTPTWMLYAHPTSSISRVNLGVYLSTFPRDADSWSEPWVIYEGPSAYSDLAYIELPSSESTAIGMPATVFVCLYENGIRSPYEQISCSIFTLHEVIQNIPANCISNCKKLPSIHKMSCITS
ncbi:sialidase-4 isoform X2 [Rhinatrema bivittatum]|nr:sialidase-4 isoform X2 [Rhinatrema bivittatum]